MCVGIPPEVGEGIDALGHGDGDGDVGEAEEAKQLEGRAEGHGGEAAPGEGGG